MTTMTTHWLHLDALQEIRDCGLELAVQVRPPGDGPVPLDRFVITHGSVMGFGDSLEDAWSDFLNCWEDDHGERLSL